MAYDDGEFLAPIKLDNDSLLHWVKFCMGYHPIIQDETYQRLEKLDVYQQMRDNPELLKRLRAVLEADVIVRETRKDRRYYFTNKAMTTISKLRFLKMKTGLEVKERVAERQKAHDAYEMLRRLSFQDPEGLVFKLEFR